MRIGVPQRDTCVLEDKVDPRQNFLNGIVPTIGRSVLFVVFTWLYQASQLLFVQVIDTLFHEELQPFICRLL